MAKNFMISTESTEHRDRYNDVVWYRHFVRLIYYGYRSTDTYYLCGYVLKNIRDFSNSGNILGI